jgi:hypothetical protein
VPESRCFQLLLLGDYTYFPNCSGGAVLYNFELLRIHTSSFHYENPKPKGGEAEETRKRLGAKGKRKAAVSPSVEDLLKYVEKEIPHKAHLGLFIPIIAIMSILVHQGVFPAPILARAIHIRMTRGRMVVSE